MVDNIENNNNAQNLSKNVIFPLFVTQGEFYCLKLFFSPYIAQWYKQWETNRPSIYGGPFTLYVPYVSASCMRIISHSFFWECEDLCSEYCFLNMSQISVHFYFISKYIFLQHLLQCKITITYTVVLYWYTVQ